MKPIKLFQNEILYCSNNEEVTFIDIDIKYRKIIVLYNGNEYQRELKALGNTLFASKNRKTYDRIIIYGKINNEIKELFSITYSIGNQVLEIYNMTEQEYLLQLHKHIGSKYSHSEKVLKYKGETDKEKIKHMVAEDMGQFRKDEYPSKAIALFKKIEPYFEEDEIDGPILVSLIAACLDTDNTSMAEQYLKQLQRSKDYQKYSRYIRNLEKRLYK